MKDHSDQAKQQAKRTAQKSFGIDNASGTGKSVLIHGPIFPEHAVHCKVISLSALTGLECSNYKLTSRRSRSAILFLPISYNPS